MRKRSDDVTEPDGLDGEPDKPGFLRTIRESFATMWDDMRGRNGRRACVVSWAMIAAMVALVAATSNALHKPTKHLETSELLMYAQEGKIKEMHISTSDGVVTGELSEPEGDVRNFDSTIAIRTDPMLERIVRSHVKFDFDQPSQLQTTIANLLLYVVQLAGFFVLILFVTKAQMGDDDDGGILGGMFGFGDASVADEIPDVTFDDVVGIPEAKEEVEELVTFLRDPGVYDRAGASFPHGVLLQGAPGVGKTLLAKALAGEAGVPFLATSGSDFEEMYVGLGARRIRRLFDRARKVQPAIIFIDEIDSVGESRSSQGTASGTMVQTLNQLLTEMDGFSDKDKIIVLAATNRGEALDPALRRPGRFDRIITIDVPAKEGREEILRLYAEGKPLAEDVDIAVLAAHTSGFSGAELKDAMNQAATLAARRAITERNGKADGGSEGAEGMPPEGTDAAVAAGDRTDDRTGAASPQPVITMADIEEGIARTMSGPAMRSRRPSDEERAITAYHEAGHAVLQCILPHCDPVQRISIVSRNIPGRGAALGYVQSYSEEDRYLMSSDQCRDEIASLLAGRAAERMFCNVETAGASDDLSRATELARNMVDIYAFDVGKGTLTANGWHGQWKMAGEERRTYVDQTVEQILKQQMGTAKRILADNREHVEAIVDELLREEVIDAERISEIMAEGTVRGYGD